MLCNKLPLEGSGIDIYTRDTDVGGSCPKGLWDGDEYTTGQITEDCSVIFSAHDSTIHLAQWAKTKTQGSSNSYYHGVTTDSNGNVYAVGYIWWWGGTYGFGNGVTVSVAPRNSVLIVKYASQ